VAPFAALKQQIAALRRHGQGWSAAETASTRSLGRRSTLTIPAPTGSGRYALEIEATAWSGRRSCKGRCRGNGWLQHQLINRISNLCDTSRCGDDTLPSRAADRARPATRWSPPSVVRLVDFTGIPVSYCPNRRRFRGGFAEWGDRFCFRLNSTVAGGRNAGGSTRIIDRRRAMKRRPPRVQTCHCGRWRHIDGLPTPPAQGLRGCW
jgi:hypothetical protein